MTAYRGVEKSELIRSIAESVTWLKKLDLGPVSREMLGEFKLVDLLEALDKAESNIDLARIMRDSGAGRFLRRFHDIFSYEAEVYPPDGTPVSEGASLFPRLMAWGAFAEVDTSDPFYELDEEMRQYQIRAALTHLAARNFNNASEQEKFAKIVAKRREDEPGMAVWLAQGLPVLIFLQENGLEGEIRETLAESNNIAGLPALLETLHGVIGIQPVSGVSMANQPIMPYGILDDKALDMGQMSWDDIQKALEPLKQTLRAILKPFYDTDEVTRISTGPRRGTDQFGVFFYATRRAAQAVADALNKAEVLDFEGHRVVPRLPPRHVAGGPQPAPGL